VSFVGLDLSVSASMFLILALWDWASNLSVSMRDDVESVSDGRIGGIGAFANSLMLLN